MLEYRSPLVDFQVVTFHIRPLSPLTLYLILQLDALTLIILFFLQLMNTVMTYVVIIIQVGGNDFKSLLSPSGHKSNFSASH